MKSARLCLIVLLFAGLAPAMDLEIPYPVVQSPVVHSGKYHILHCGRASVVLDSSKGLAIARIGENAAVSAPGARDEVRFAESLADVSLQVELTRGLEKILLDQAFDGHPRLQIISLGDTHTAARVFFTMYSKDGRAYGTGTMDFYVYDRSLHLVPSVFIDYSDPALQITRAGLVAHVPVENASVEIKDRRVSRNQWNYFEPFGGESEDFHMTVSLPDRSPIRIGWLRNVYPSFLYLREIDKNPETDELYDRWPPWISQRGQPLAWKIGPMSGVEANFGQSGLDNIALLWVRSDPKPQPAPAEGLPIPEGGYSVFNGALSIFWGRDKPDLESRWRAYQNPIKPAMETGTFKFYNELEGLYEVDTQGKPAALTIDCRREKADRPIVFRFWNLAGKNACIIKLNGEAVPFSLMNDGGLVEDPMVFIVKEATGPANYALASFVAPKGKVSRLTLERAPGMQFTCQMYTEHETFEAWSDECTDSPLFLFHLREGSLYHARLPGRENYAFFKLPLFWVKNGVNPATFMDSAQAFKITANGPEAVEFQFFAINPQGSGLSTYTCRVPYEAQTLRFLISAEFTPLDDGKRWTSLEYCDLYPFDGVYRRDFHFKDVVYLTQKGFFERTGTGAWDHYFQVKEEPERLGHFAAYVPREGPGSKVPHPADGSVWLLGDNPRRGNILFRREDFNLAEGSEPAFSLCNAWVDIHNALTRSGKALSSGERVNFAVEVFGGRLPAVDDLYGMYREALGDRQGVQRLDSVIYSKDGTIKGFKIK